MPWRIAPAWPVTPPPSTLTMALKRPSVPVTRKGMRRSPSSMALPKCSLERAAVDDDLALAGHQPDARDGGLASTGPVEEGGGGHAACSSSGERLRPLGLVRMVLAGVDLELAELLGAEAVVRQHALHGAADDLLRAAREQVAEGLLLVALRVAAVAGVELGRQLVAG